MTLGLRQSLRILRLVPPRWWIPKGDRLFLALFSPAFWGITGWQAIERGAHGASVYTFFGLGLLYVVFGLRNLIGAAAHAYADYCRTGKNAEGVKDFVQLILVMGMMLLLNAWVLGIYVVQRAPVTPFDIAIAAVDLVLVASLAIKYRREMLTNPFSLGWLAIGGKTVPQLALSVLFWVRKATAAAFSPLTLIGIIILSNNRALPIARNMWHGPRTLELKGTWLGDGPNAGSAWLMLICWVLVLQVVPALGR